MRFESNDESINLLIIGVLLLFISIFFAGNIAVINLSSLSIIFTGLSLSKQIRWRE